MDSYPPHLQSHFTPPQLQNLTAPLPPYLSTNQPCRILPAPKGIVLAAGPAGRTSSRVSRWNAWSSLSGLEFLPNDKNNRLTTSRSLHTQQAVSSCLQHCLRSARYLPDFQSSSSPSVSIHRLPSCRTRLFCFPSYSPIQYARIQRASIHRYVSRGWALQEGVESCRKRHTKMPPFTCTPTFSFRAFDSRKLITFSSELQEVALLGPAPSPSRARTSPLVTGMTVSLSTTPERMRPRLPSRP